MHMAHTLAIMAAGLGTRFGGDKQLEPLGPSGELLLDYAMRDAVRAGFRRIVIVVRPELESLLAPRLERLDPAPESIVMARQEGMGAPRRARPWGTAHAVLAAASCYEGAFAVCNADDWYGPGAFELAARHLDALRSDGPPEHAIIAYRLDRTLSRHGGVARGIAEVDGSRMLRGLVEVRDLRRGSDGVITGTVDGTMRSYAGSEPVSMNLWAFDPRLREPLRSQFEDFLREHRNSESAELALSTAIGEQVAAGIARVKVIPTDEEWMGVTFRADVEEVKRRLAGKQVGR